MGEAAKLVLRYEAGILIRHELLIRLCQAAADRAPAEIAAELPADVLAEIRDWSIAPPDSPKGCRVYHAGSFVGSDESWERHFRTESHQLYAGLWRWHEYFAEAERD